MKNWLKKINHHHNLECRCKVLVEKELLQISTTGKALKAKLELLAMLAEQDLHDD